MSQQMEKAEEYSFIRDLVLCTQCLAVLQKYANRLQNDPGYLNWTEHRKTNDLRLAAQANCVSCAYVHKTVGKGLADAEDEFWINAECYFFKDQTYGYSYMLMMFYKFSTEDNCEIFFKPVENSVKVTGHSETEARPRLALDSLTGQTSAAISSRNDSESSYKLVRSWIDQCGSEHHCLRETHYPELPTRLIDLGEGAEPQAKLCQTASMPASTKYTTLSHCWGGLKFTVLTQHSFSTFEEGIPTSELPLSIVEAMEIAHKLGSRYIWIDCLCIVQDDPEDWLKEGSRMSSIYQSSWLNICASKAADGSAGCFAERHPTEIRTPLYQTSSIKGLETRPLLFFDNDLWKRHVHQLPLLTRGWVVQEQLLAPRNVYYGREQMFWECCSLKACETYPEGVPSSRLPITEKQEIRELIDAFEESQGIKAPFAGQPPKSVNFTEMGEKWRYIIQKYSATHLSYPVKDKLVAISGVARAIGLGGRNGAYVAGLWQQDLWAELLWQKADTPEGVSRTHSYQAPSWSWACSNDPIEFLHIFERSPQTFSSSIAGVGAKMADQRNPFGAVVAGRIILAGPAFPLSALPVHIMKRPSWMRFAWVTEACKGVGNVRFDDHALYEKYKGPADITKESFVLFILDSHQDGNEHTQVYYSFGLVLKRTSDPVEGDKGVYNRCGAFYLQGECPLEAIIQKARMTYLGPLMGDLQSIEGQAGELDEGWYKETMTDQADGFKAYVLTVV